MKTRRQHVRRRLGLMVHIIVIVATMNQALSVLGKEPAASPRHPINGRSTRRNHLSRRIQSWMIKQKAIPKTRILGQKTALGPSKRGRNAPGSVLTIQKHTKANIGRWFCADEDPGNLRSMLSRELYHGEH